MNTSIVGRHIELTEPIKNYVSSSVEIFKKYNLDIISVNSIISQDDKNGGKAFTFEFTLNVASLDTIVVKQKDKDLYSAIDIATDRVSKILRRHHDKITEHKAIKLSEIDAATVEDKVAKELEKFENEIIPVKLASYKPIDIEEALDSLKATEDLFKVFYDKDDNLRVLYKTKKEGNFGLY